MSGIPNPYTIVLPDVEDKLEISIEQINSNSYDGDKLSEPVTATGSSFEEKMVTRTSPV
jgi:hypothetical protein